MNWLLGCTCFSFLYICGCTSPGVKLETDRHINSIASQGLIAGKDVPPPVTRSYQLPPPRAQGKPDTYSVVVNNVKVQDLLFALARDAKVNLDIHPGISGVVTLNALDQTLPQLLTRIGKQVDMRFELDGPNLSVMPDSPFLRNYKIDYVNLARDTTSLVAVSSQIGATGSGAGATSAAGSGSFAKIESSSKNRFWDSVVQNVKDLLQETDKVFPAGAQEKTVESAATQKIISLPIPSSSSQSKETGSKGGDTETTTVKVEKTVSFREAASVIANAETGVLSIRATSRQHEKVQEFLSKVMNSAKRQVLVEATIAEVQLTKNYQQGIDWSVLNVFDTGLRIIQKAVGAISGPSSTLLELGHDSKGGNFTSAVKLLESFGTVKVLSSPKLSVMNNQTAIMKVVDDNIYFTYEIKETEATQTTAGKTTITSTLHSVPVGLVLTITPQIGDDDSVTLSMRPSLSRVIGQKEDPSIQFVQGGATVRNTIPIIRAREFDSVMRVSNGNVAVMGGLMEDLLDNNDDTVPGVGSLPLIGGLFQNRNDSKSKTELVIFVRPTVITSNSAENGFAAYRSQLPGADFFVENNGPASFTLPGAAP